MSDITPATELQLIAERIRLRMKRTTEDIVAIGQELTEAQALLAKPGSDGLFTEWLRDEFDMSKTAAYRFIHVAERFGNSTNLVQLPTSILYQLAAPSTPETVIQQVTSGDIPATTKEVKAAIAQAKEAAQQAQEAQSLATSRQRTIDALKAELDQARAQAKPKTTEKLVPDPKQAKRIQDLEGALQEALHDRTVAEHQVEALQMQFSQSTEEEQARTRWKTQAQEMSIRLRQAIAYLPSQDDMAYFGVAEWRLVDDMERYTHQVVSALANLRLQIIDAR